MDTMTVNPTQLSTVSLSPAPAHVHNNVVQKSETPIQSIQVADSGQSEQKNGTSLEDQKKILQESTKKFNEMSDTLNLDVKFAYNEKIDQVYLNVIEKNTGRVIRKLPSEEAMKISESMKELVGNLLDKKG